MINRIILAILLLFSACSCQKMSDNGLLDGNWQLMTLEHLDGSVPPEDMKDKKIYLALQLNMFSFQGLNAERGTFNFVDNKLYFNFVNKEQTTIRYLGEKTDLQELTVEQLDRKTMTLTTKILRLSFRRF